MINPEIDRLYDDELLDDGSNSFDRYFLPYFDSIHLDPKKKRKVMSMIFTLDLLVIHNAAI